MTRIQTIKTSIPLRASTVEIYSISKATRKKKKTYLWYSFYIVGLAACLKLFSRGTISISERGHVLQYFYAKALCAYYFWGHLTLPPD